MNYAGLAGAAGKQEAAVKKAGVDAPAIGQEEVDQKTIEISVNHDNRLGSEALYLQG